jgi:arylsulfatase A-like enzyme
MSISPASAQQLKPNILVIMADDIGYWNISAYNRGMMGYRTPNIDRIANEGARTWGKQNCEDTGALDKKRMENIDQEFLEATLNFIDRANRDKKPFLAWFNPSRMHIWTRLKPEAQGKTGLGLYPETRRPGWAASEKAR